MLRRRFAPPASVIRVFHCVRHSRDDPMNRTSALIVAVLLAVAAQHALALTILTEENPPLNFTKNGQITGTATATVQEMLRRAGLSADIRVLPWSEAYAQAQSDPATCVYSTSRLPARYKLFQWVGPIARGY